MLSAEQWDCVAAFHGHKCPGLAIGFKACEGALGELGLNASEWPSADEELVCVTENDACGVDAVQALLSCTYGKGNLIPRLRGKMAFSFFVRGTDCAVRLCLKADRNDLPRDEYMAYLLDTPYQELFAITRPGYTLPEEARIFGSQCCAVCGEETAEYALRVQGGQLVCLDCYNAYQREGF